MTVYVICSAEMGIAPLRVMWGKSIMGAERAGLNDIEKPVCILLEARIYIVIRWNTQASLYIPPPLHSTSTLFCQRYTC
jgi:hypothetical protein